MHSESMSKRPERLKILNLEMVVTIIILSVIIVAFLFASSEFIRKYFILNNNSTDTLSYLYISRSILVTFTVALWAIWYILVYQRSYQEELLKSEEKFRGIVEHSSDAITVATPDGICLEWNKGAEMMYGYKREEVIGRPFMIIPEDKINELKTLYDKVKSGQAVSKHITKRITKDGRLLDVQLSLHPLKNYNGDIIGIVGIGRDITKDIRMFKEMQEAEKLAGIGRLAAGIAHQVNTPLGAILLTTQMLMEEREEDKELYDELKLIETKVKYIKEVIKKLMEYTHAPARSDAKIIDLKEVLYNIMELFEKRIKHLGIEKKIDIKNDNLTIIGDKNQLEQVFFNIISNAIDAIEEGGGRLDIKMWSTSERIICEIKDTGTGIPKDMIDKIFEPFFTTKGVGRGTGLGLSVCYGIMKSIGGKIEVESEKGKGSLFRLIFPKQKIGGKHDEP